MFNEEILLRMGLDSRQVDAGLSGLRGKLDAFAAQAKRAFASIFGAVGMGMVMTHVQKILDYAERIASKAQSWGVSAKFYQDLVNIAKAAGVAEQAMERGFEKFRRDLPNGSDAETEFLKISDSIAAIEDPAERARMAVAKFGKAGEEILPIVAAGAKEIQKMAEGFSVLSDKQIRDLNRVGDTLDVSKQKGLFVGAMVLSSAAVDLQNILGTLELLTKSDNSPGLNLSKLGRMGLTHFGKWGDILFPQAAQPPTPPKDDAERLQRHLRFLDELQLKYGSNADKLSVLTRQLDEAYKVLENATNDSEYLDRLENYLKLQKELFDLQAKMTNAERESAEKQMQAAQRRLAAEQEISNLIHDAERQKQETYMPSLNDLANTKGPYQHIAQEIQRREQAARDAFIAGRPDLAEQHIAFIEGGPDGNRGPRLGSGTLGRGKVGSGSLGGLGFLPSKGLKQILEDARVQPHNPQLEQLDKRVQGILDRLDKPLPVIPHNGE